MDAGIADTLNRRDAQLFAARISLLDQELTGATVTAALLSDSPDTRSYRAWLVGRLAPHTPGLRFDGEPADGDWDNLFSHIRAEILARRTRDQNPPPVRDQPLCGMV